MAPLRHGRQGTERAKGLKTFRVLFFQYGEITGRRWGYHHMNLVISPGFHLTVENDSRKQNLQQVGITWFSAEGSLAYSLHFVLHRPLSGFKGFSILFKENSIAVQCDSDWHNFMGCGVVDDHGTRYGDIRHPGPAGHRELPFLSPVPRYGPVRRIRRQTNPRSR